MRYLARTALPTINPRGCPQTVFGEITNATGHRPVSRFPKATYGWRRLANPWQRVSLKFDGGSPGSDFRVTLERVG